jgi:DNA mismatch endonuclease, patch repair protein
MDNVTRKRRTEIMGLVKSANTRPEIAVRKILHHLGYRFRLQTNYLPGKPDVVLPKWNVIVLIHGCFWHRHKGCPNTRTPKSSVKFWKEKFNCNVIRDKLVRKSLQALGWRVLVIWECELIDPESLTNRLDDFIKTNQVRL